MTKTSLKLFQFISAAENHVSRSASWEMVFVYLLVALSLLTSVWKIHTLKKLFSAAPLFTTAQQAARHVLIC